MENEQNPRQRLLSVLESTGLKQNDFALRLGVSAASISHIISEKGRQADITENIAERIISAFPDLHLSKKWLLTGVEEEINGEDTHPNLFNIDKPDFSARPSQPTPEVMQNNNVKKEYYSHDSAPSAPTPTTHNESSAEKQETESSPKKVVERIVIFYSDGTFDDYSPARSK